MKYGQIIFALPIIAFVFVDGANAAAKSKDVIYGLDSETPVYTATGKQAAAPASKSNDVIYGLDSRTQRYTAVGAGREKFDSKFYIGARFDFNLASFQNEYSDASGTRDKLTDSFSFVQQLGFDIAAGYQFAPRWRAELNYVNTGKYSDKDTGGTFDLSSQFFMLNGLYTINIWTTTSIYTGFGVGIGMLTTKFADIYFAPDAELSKTSMGFAGQAMIGIEEKIAEQLYLGLTYKLSYMTGHKQEIAIDPLMNGGVVDTFISETSGILNNTFGVGLRLEF
ncbi:MAG: porin family protein [Alphaproteobacteria bacterium]|nr:porin family protein [Alphaproteobacteria bacterium]